MGPGFSLPPEAFALIAAVAGPMLLAFGWATRRWVARKDRRAAEEAEQTRRNREQAEELTAKLIEARQELLEARGEAALRAKLLEWCEQDRQALRERLYGGPGVQRTGDGA